MPRPADTMITVCRLRAGDARGLQASPPGDAAGAGLAALDTSGLYGYARRSAPLATAWFGP